MATEKLEKSSTYYWSGVTKSGALVKRQKIVAPNQSSAIAALAKEGVTLTKISTGGLSLNMEVGSGEVKFKWAQKAEFSRRMYQMLRAGISLSRTLQSLGEEASDKVSDMCNDLADRVSGGQSLSQALKTYPKAFDEVFVAYVQAGEDSGTLVETMGNLSILMAKRAAMQSKIKAVMAYPKMVGGAILVMVFGILLFLVPSYAKIYDSFGAKLPAPTQALVGLSQNILPFAGDNSKAWVKIPLGPLPFSFNPVALMSIIGIIWGSWVFFRKQTAENENVNLKLAKFRFKMPILGKLNHKSALFRWSSTLSGALSSGVGAARGVELAADAAGSYWFQYLVPDFTAAIRSGKNLSDEMSKHKDLFPANIRTMMATGEETGEIDEMLKSVSQALDEEVDSIVAGLSAQLEVALLIGLGIVVGGLLVVLYLPILQLAATASKGLGAG